MPETVYAIILVMPTRKPAKSSSKTSKKGARQAASAKTQRASRKPVTQKSKRSSRKPASSPRKTGKALSRPKFSLRFPGSDLPLDRKLDSLGVFLSLLGLLNFLVLISPTNSRPIEFVITSVGLALGWGKFVLPIILIIFGLWLVMRHLERIPHLTLERTIGLLLFFLVLLIGLHFSQLEEGRSANFDLAQQGMGGGYIGAFLLSGLQTSLGWAGTGIALAALSLIAVILTFDVSIPQLFTWTSPLIERVSQSVRSSVSQWKENRKASRSITPTSFTPYKSTNTPPTPTVKISTGLSSNLIETSSPARLEWVLPPISEILESGGDAIYDDEIDRQRARVIEETLSSFGAPARVVEINRGPTITQFGVEPGFLESRGGQMRVRVSKITSLADDLALALSARRIRIQAPVPSRGFVGIEVPNEDVTLVALRDVMESETFKKIKTPLRIALGQDVGGKPAAADLAAMPHLLIAGTTGSGKSVCVNSLICCLLLNNTPDELRMVMVDPKRVELTGYNGIPHLLAPVVVELERVVGALQWIVREMDKRYHMLAKAGVRNIVEYNNRLTSLNGPKLPYLVVVVDELADLMMLAPDETERLITRLAQLARATGIHLVIATQRPSVDVVTGLIKANFPARIAFAVASGVDSRVILDQPGAERLLGRGDMLFQAPDAGAPVRLQGTFVSDNEIAMLVAYWRQFLGNPVTSQTAVSGVVDSLPTGIPLKQMPMWEEMQPEEQIDPLFDEAVDLVRRQGRGSISMLQRRLRIGYTRAARLIETMQDKGILGQTQPGNLGVEVLDYGPAAPPAED
jgi:DNA segregation ATPase FtsK/SpoIIIE, S-DNA-T family